jgi:Phage integrase, N-terminal SAM-like domain
MPGWILERELTNGTSVFDIGYRVNGRTVRRKAGTTREEAQSALTIAVTEVETGTIRVHTTDTLRTYALRWLARREPFVEPGTIQAYRNDVIYRIIPTLGDVGLRRLTTERIEEAILDMQKLKLRRGSPNPTYSSKTINNTLTTLAVPRA